MEPDSGLLRARHALNGKWWSSLLVVVLWAVVMTVIPVITGEVDAETVTAADTDQDFPGGITVPGPDGEPVVPPFSLRDLEEGGGTFPGVDIPGLGDTGEFDEGFTLPEEAAPQVEPTPDSDDASPTDAGQ
ncbi:hypothetical protein HC928_21210 [bacterium]|nr:hypothetical protein [bacterium]